MALKKIGYLMLTFILFVPTLLLQNVAEAANHTVVNPSVTYTYAAMTRHIQSLAQKYPDLIQYKSIGKTKYGRDIWAVGLGHGQATVFINGSHHAREWMTTTINMYMLEQYAIAYSANRPFEGYNTRQILDRTTIWFVPMVNPDGVTLQQQGTDAFPASVRQALVQMNGGSTNFKRWKANAQGIDPNRQYDAYWRTIEDNIPYPFWKNHKGTSAVQTAENQATTSFTYEIDPEIAVSYHSAGRILYWNFHTLPQNLSRDKRLANIFTSFTGYRQVRPNNNPSGGGYTDWFITTFGRPAFTPEIGIKTGETNLPLSAFNEEWQRNKKVGLWIAQEGYSLWLKKNPTTPASPTTPTQPPANPLRRSLNVTLDGVNVKKEIPAFVQNKVAYISYKPLLTLYGFAFFWDQANQKITATSSASGTATFTLNQTAAEINGVSSALQGAPINVDGTVYVPISLISQLTGIAMTMNEKGDTVILTSPDTTIPSPAAEIITEDANPSSTPIPEPSPTEQPTVAPDPDAGES